MDTKIKEKINDILNNYCYCSLFNKSLTSLNFVSHFIILYGIKTKNTDDFGHWELEGFEMPLVTLKGLKDEELWKSVLKHYQQFKKFFLVSVDDGYLTKKIKTIKSRLAGNLYDEDKKRNKLSKRKIELLKEFYRGEIGGEITELARTGFVKSSEDKNYIHFKAPILDIQPIESDDLDYKNIKEWILPTKKKDSYFI